MLKIILYSIDYGETVVRALPYVRYLNERSLYHLADLQRLDMRMILITPDGLDRYVLNYHFRELYQLDEARLQKALDRLVLLSPASTTCGSLGERVLADPEILSRLDKERKKASTVKLINYAPSLASDALATRLGVDPEEGPFESSLRWGSKSGSKEIFRIAGVPTPEGPSTVFWASADVEKIITQIARSIPSPRHMIIKLNDPSWGNAIGNAVIDCDKLLRHNDLSRAIETIAQSWDDFAQEIPRCGAIVEHYLTDSVCSPSGQGYIDQEGHVSVISTHDQYVMAGKYSGCSFPGTNTFIPKARSAVLKVGQILSTYGVYGHYGVDFIGLSNGELLATEINLRKVGPTHVFAYTASIVRGRVEEDGYLRTKGSQISYVHRRLYRPDLLLGIDPRFAVEKLKAAGLHYNHETKEGAILHTLGALQPCGFIELTCIAHEPANAIALQQEVETVLLNANLRMSHN